MARFHGILLYRLGHEVWGEWSYNGRDMIISSNNVIPFSRGGGAILSPTTESMVQDDQWSILNGHTTDVGEKTNIKS